MSFPKHRPKSPLCFALLGSGMLAGLLGLGTVLLHGQPEVYNAARELPWGVLAVTYILLVVSSTGLGFASLLGRIFRIDHFDRFGKVVLILAILTLLCGLGVVAPEFADPASLSICAAGRSALFSAVHWAAPLYGIYLALLCGELALTARGIRKGTVALGILGFIVSIWAHSHLLSVFGLREDRHFWPGAILPIYFAFSAMVSGGIAVSLIAYFRHKESAPHLPRRCSTFMGTLEKLRCFFLTIPLFGVVVGIFFMRCHAGIFGRISDIQEGSGLPQYTPCLADIAILSGAVSTCLYLYAMAEKFLSLEGDS